MKIFKNIGCLLILSFLQACGEQEATKFGFGSGVSITNRIFTVDLSDEGYAVDNDSELRPSLDFNESYSDYDIVIRPEGDFCSKNIDDISIEIIPLVREVDRNSFWDNSREGKHGTKIYFDTKNLKNVFTGSQYTSRVLNCPEESNGAAWSIPEQLLYLKKLYEKSANSANKYYKSRHEMMQILFSGGEEDKIYQVVDNEIKCDFSGEDDFESEHDIMRNCANNIYILNEDD